MSVPLGEGCKVLHPEIEDFTIEGKGRSPG
jgi:hypothetical protein